MRRNRFLVTFNEHELQGFLTQIECGKREGDAEVISEIRRELEIRKNEPSSTQKDIQAPFSSGCSLSED
jgi:hypothetical protein